MNIILNPGQSNTKRGDINLPAAGNLTGCENLLWKIVNNNGVANFALPTSTDDYAPYVGASGDVAGNNVTAEAPGFGENFRVVCKGAVNPGDQICLADPGTAADAGKVRALPSGAGTFRVFAIAEEAGVDGQLLLCRKIGERTISH